MKYVNPQDPETNPTQQEQTTVPATSAAPQTPTLAQIREDLARDLKWDPKLTPAFVELPHPGLTERAIRGYVGEDHLARTAVARGEVILDGPVGIEDWNKGGPDLVTLAEKPDGLVVKFYDNKATTTRKNVSSVPALNQNFEASLAEYREEWSRLAIDPTRTAAEHKLFATAGKLVDEGRISRIVTNFAGRVEGTTDRVVQAGLEFEDLAGPLEPKPLPPAFAATETLPPPQATQPTVDPLTLAPKPRVRPS